MDTLDFRELANLLNSSRTTSIDLEAVAGREAGWALYEAHHKVHTSRYPFNVIYLYSRATLEDIENAAQSVGSREKTHVIYAPSIRQRPEVLRKRFSSAEGVWTAREYLASFLKDELQTYLERVTSDPPAYYTEPPVDTPSGFRRKRPNPLLSYLLDIDPGSGIPAGALAILLAEPGQGKTYMSRHLIGEVAHQTRRELVPLLIDSSQWNEMALSDQSSLWKTITHTFRHFDSPIAWVEGNEDEFLRVALKADLFRVVFDGFDEYILRNRTAVQPMDVLESLAQLASSTSARIVLTSRTSFWETNLPGTEVSEFVTRTGSFVYRILPFDTPHANNYFAERLKTPPETERALSIYRSLRASNEDFVGRGFVLSLVADLVEREGSLPSNTPKGSDGLAWLVRALCEREERRQDLPFNADQQISILREFAVEVALGESPTTDVLEYCMGVVKPELDVGAREGCIEKFKSHPLLEKDPDSDYWTFRQEQLRFLLLADHVLRLAPHEAKRFTDSATFEADQLQDLGEMIVSNIKAGSAAVDAAPRIRELIHALTAKDLSSVRVPRESHGSRLSGILVLMGVEQFQPKGSPHADRTALLMDLSGGKSIRGLVLGGTIAGFDFRGLEFDRCKFEQITWVNCRFDNTTTFNHCHFVGNIPPIRCEGLAEIKLIEPALDEEATSFFNSVQVRAGKRKYDADDLRNDLDAVLGKFINKGGLGLKSVQRRNISKGPISSSPHRDEILEAVESMLLEQHAISGTSEPGYNVRKSAAEAMKFYAVNNVLTGDLRDVYERLIAKLVPQ